MNDESLVVKYRVPAGCLVRIAVELTERGAVLDLRLIDEEGGQSHATGNWRMSVEKEEKS
jgi:hypothetical protein